MSQLTSMDTASAQMPCKIELPPCGLLLGHGVYNNRGVYPGGSGGYYQQWSYQRLSIPEIIEATVKENQGNLIQFWWFGEPKRPLPRADWLAMEDLGFTCPGPDWTNLKSLAADEFPEMEKVRQARAGAGVLKALQLCESHGLYSTMIYLSGVNPEISKRFTANPHYIGYDFGERFCIRFEGEAGNQAPRLDDGSRLRLDKAAATFTEAVRQHVKECREKGFGPICCTSGNFYMDYEVAAGVDFTLYEDVTSELNWVSGFSRGLARQYGRELWGSHIANEYYSWIDVSNPSRWKTLYAEMAMKYLAGAKIIICESGGWHVQTPGGGSPNGKLISRKPGRIGTPLPPDAEQAEQARFIESVRDQLDDRSDWSRAFRRQLSDFYDYVKSNPAPKGQPETTVALAKGNYDLSSALGLDARPSFNGTIAGLGSYAEAHMEWMNGAPEFGWNFAMDIFWPRPQGIYGNGDYNRVFSGTPYGQVDIVSFAYDQPTAEFLLKNYKALVFLGWNTCSEKQYKVLCEYVKGGGKLFISIPHLSTDVTRNYQAYTVDDLVNTGDFTELCGVKVKGRGPYFYWASSPHSGNRGAATAPGNLPPWGYYRISGAYRGVVGDLEISNPEAKLVLSDIESDTGVLYRLPSGKGEVWFLNSWFYPGVYRENYGTGTVPGDTGFVGDVIKYLAKVSRGDVYITEKETDDPGSECDYVDFSHFPSDGTVILLNIDFAKPHTFDLHILGKTETVTLKPHELRRIPKMRHCRCATGEHSCARSDSRGGC